MDKQKINLGIVSLHHEGDWNKTNEYKKLAIVYDEKTFQSYIAKIDVPKNIEITNETYWSRIVKNTGSDAANIVALKKDMTDVKENIIELYNYSYNIYDNILNKEDYITLDYEIIPNNKLIEKNVTNQVLLIKLEVTKSGQKIDNPEVFIEAQAIKENVSNVLSFIPASKPVTFQIAVVMEDMVVHVEQFKLKPVNPLYYGKYDGVFNLNALTKLTKELTDNVNSYFVPIKDNHNKICYIVSPYELGAIIHNGIDKLQEFSLTKRTDIVLNENYFVYKNVNNIVGTLLLYGKK